MTPNPTAATSRDTQRDLGPADTGQPAAAVTSVDTATTNRHPY